MSFVYRASKFVTQEPPSLGPGAYDPQQPQAKFNHNSVFVSGTPRIPRSQNNPLGPGNYDITAATQSLAYPRNLAVQCKATFKSKVNRFGDQKSVNIKKENGFEGYDLLFEKKEQKNLGKLFGISRDHQKLALSIPSIPSHEHSYGYKVDHRTDKLVLNENPNVLLTKKYDLHNDLKQRQQEKKKQGPGSYFISPLKDQKSLKWQPEKEKKQHQIHLPSESYHLPLKWNEKGNTLISKCERFPQNSFSKRESLLMKIMRKKFADFIRDENKLEQLVKKEKNQFEEREEQQQDIILKRSRNIQCFMSKEDRFKKKTQQNEAQPIPIVKQQKKQSMEKTKRSLKPFGKGEQRFKSLPKLNVGPGSYQSDKIQKKERKIFVGLNEMRFSTEMSDQPGPGAYDVSFTKEPPTRSIRSNKLKQSILKFMNVQIEGEKEKMLKLENQGSPYIPLQEEQDKEMKKPRDLQENSKSNRREILKKIQNMVDKKKQKNISTKSQKSKETIIRASKLKKHPIPYHHLEKKPSDLGPGSFDIQHSLIRKTFNVTYT